MYYFSGELKCNLGVRNAEGLSKTELHLRGIQTVVAEFILQFH